MSLIRAFGLENEAALATGSTRETFWTAYHAALLAAVQAKPQDYALKPGESAEEYAITTAKKMRAAVESRHPESSHAPGVVRGFGAINYRTPTFRKACAAAGVPFNRKGLDSLYA